MSKNQQAPAESTAHPYGSLDLTLEKLRSRRGEITAEILRLEAKGAKRTDDVAPPPVHLRALEMLNGYAPKSDLGSVAGSLSRLFSEREAIDVAVEIGNRQNISILAERLAVELRDRMNEWHELVYQQAVSVVALRRVNAACENFKQSFVGLGAGMPTLPCDHFRLLGARDEVDRFLAAAKAAGIISEKGLSDV